MKATYYAQNREDMILHTLLWGVKKGFYVDVGANHPDSHSVTKYFYEQGWRGINIEPIPSLYKLLMSSRKKDINLNLGVSNESSELLFREYSGVQHGLSTFSSAMQSKTKGEYNEYMVPVRPLRDILKEQGVRRIDFLKVDVEGHEREVLLSNDWKKYRPTVVVVENTPGGWVSILLSNGYKQVFFDGLNRYFVLKENLKTNTMRNFHHVLTGDFQTAEEAKLKKELLVQGAKLQNMYELHTDLGKRFHAMSTNPAGFFGLRIVVRSMVQTLIQRVKASLLKGPSKG